MNQTIKTLSEKIELEISKFDTGNETGADQFQIEHACDALQSLADSLNFLHAALRSRTEHGRRLQVNMSKDKFIAGNAFISLLETE